MKEHLVNKTTIECITSIHPSNPRIGNAKGYALCIGVRK